MTTQTKSVDTERIEEGFRLLGLGTEADRQRLRSLADLVRPNDLPEAAESPRGA